jgi:hypothetical protein
VRHSLATAAGVGAAMVALTFAIAGDAMADRLETTELFDVEIDELAGALALIARKPGFTALRARALCARS